MGDCGDCECGETVEHECFTASLYLLKFPKLVLGIISFFCRLSQFLLFFLRFEGF